MSASLADATAAENTAIQAYDSLMAAKTKEINALTKARLYGTFSFVGLLGDSPLAAPPGHRMRPRRVHPEGARGAQGPKGP